jgi:glutamate-1-semialdehyde aminotransferase
LTDITGRHSLPASVIGVASCFALHFRPQAPRNARETADSDAKASKAFYEHMLNSNIAFMTPSVCHAWVCEPHTEKDIEEFLAAAEEFFRKYKG